MSALPGRTQRYVHASLCEGDGLHLQVVLQYLAALSTMLDNVASRSDPKPASKRANLRGGMEQPFGRRARARTIEDRLCMYKLIGCHG